MLDGLDWEFRDPWFLLLLPLAWVAFMLATRSSAAIGYSSVASVERMPKSLRLRLSKLPGLLWGLALIALIIGLARPRTPERETRVSRNGIAIMMIVDRSSSMNARDLVKDDVSVNRLDVVKDVFASFVLGGGGTDGRPDDLVGLVTFAGYADSVCPLTLDHGNLTTVVKDLELADSRSEDGTAIGDGLGLAVERLRRSQAQSRIAILLTDGVHNAGAIDPSKAAGLAAEYDIKVYCIGAGTNGVAPIPTTDLFGRPTLVGQPVNIDEAMLREIATKTGGKYYRAQDREALAEIYADIDGLERTEVTEMRYLRYTEHFGNFLWIGLGLLLLAAVLNASLFRKLPG